jgi:hypothetical protein
VEDDVTNLGNFKGNTWLMVEVVKSLMWSILMPALVMMVFDVAWCGAWRELEEELGTDTDTEEED